MGSEDETYVGFYIVVPPVKKDVVKIFYEDSNGRTKHTPFCPKTGEKYKEVPVEVSETKAVNQYLIFEPLGEAGEDVLVMPHYVGGYENNKYFIPNMRDAGFRMSEDESGEYNLSGLKMDVDSMIKKFKLEFKDFLDLLEKDYENVEVRFGVIECSF